MLYPPSIFSHGSATAELSLPPGVTPASFGPGKNITFNEWSPDAAALELQPGERITVVFFAYLTMEWEPVRGVHLWSCACSSERSSTLVVVSTQSLFRISIVGAFGAFSNSAHRPRRPCLCRLTLQYVKLYLHDLKACGLADAAAAIHVVLTTRNAKWLNRLDEATAFARTALPYGTDKLFFHTNVGNQWEYPGINRVWESAQAAPSAQHYVLYFHAKGITRHIPEPPLFRAVVGNFRGVVDVFRSHSTINKVCGVCSMCTRCSAQVPEGVPPCVSVDLIVATLLPRWASSRVRRASFGSTTGGEGPATSLQTTLPSLGMLRVAELRGITTWGGLGSRCVGQTPLATNFSPSLSWLQNTLLLNNCVPCHNFGAVSEPGL